MEAATLPEQEEGAPVEGAEATRSSAHLFQYSDYVHAGEGADECEHREDGKCQEADHFHAWLCLPNTLQYHDIEEKARAAQARRKRAMREAGDDERPATDAYVMLESELDDLMHGPREPVLEGIVDREQRRKFNEFVRETTEEDRFEHYDQDREEYGRLAALSEEERPTEEWEALDARMSEFGKAVQERLDGARETELESLRTGSDDYIRDQLRDSRIEGEARAQYTHVYYQWLAFVCTRKAAKHQTRLFETLQALRDAPPEALAAVEAGVRDLEFRYARGDAAGN